MVGVAAGLATLGYVPWLSSFGVFLTHRAADPVRMLVAQTHANVKIGAAYTGPPHGLHRQDPPGRRGPRDHAGDAGHDRARPGRRRPSASRWSAGRARCRDRSTSAWRATPGPDLVRPGLRVRARAGSCSLREGTDVLIVSTGMQTARCLAAAALLEADGISAGVLHVPSLKPVDARRDRGGRRVACRWSSASRSTRSSAGWAGSWPRSWASATPRRIVRIGIEDTWGESAPNAFLLDRHGLSPERVAERVAREVRAPSRAGRCLDGRGVMTTTSRGDGMTHVRDQGPDQHRGRLPRRRAGSGVTHLHDAGRDPERPARRRRRPRSGRGGERPRARARRPGHDRRARRDQRPGGRGRRHRHADVAPTRRSSRPRCGPARRSGARSRSRSTSPRPSRVVALWRETGIPVQMGFMRRFDPGYVRAKALIDAGELGRIEQFRAYSRDTYLPPAKFIRDSGGSFLDMSVHDFDLARFLVGEVEEVSAWGSNLIDQRFEDGGDVDTAVTMLRFQNGALGVVEMSRRSAWGYDIRTEVAGALGKVVVEAPHKTDADVVAAVRLRGRPLRELPGPVRGRLPARVRGVLPDAGRGRHADARARTMRSRPSGSRWPPSAAGSRAVRSAWTRSRPCPRDGASSGTSGPPAGATGTLLDVTPAERRLALPVVPRRRARPGRDDRRGAAGRGAGRGARSPDPGRSGSPARPPGRAARRVHGQAARPLPAARDGVRDRRRRRVRGRDRVGAGRRPLSGPAVPRPTSCRASCAAAPTSAAA